VVQEGAEYRGKGCKSTGQKGRFKSGKIGYKSLNHQNKEIHKDHLNKNPS
jgi:hypothetical protein